MPSKKNKAPMASAWTVSMTEEKLVHKYQCPTCGHFGTREKDKYAPFCSPCLDKALAKIGLKRMKDLGPLPKKDQPKSGWAWAEAAKKIKPTRKRLTR